MDADHRESQRARIVIISGHGPAPSEMLENISDLKGHYRRTLVFVEEFAARFEAGHLRFPPRAPRFPPRSRGTCISKLSPPRTSRSRPECSPKCLAVCVLESIVIISEHEPAPLGMFKNINDFIRYNR